MATELIDNFKAMYKDATSLTPEMLAGVYDRDLVFIDPIHRIDGLDAVSDYMQRMYANVVSCGFRYHEDVVADGKAFIQWDMRLCHSKLASGREVVVRGATFVRFADRITWHEDYFDVGNLLYENVPVLNVPVKYIKNRLAG